MDISRFDASCCDICGNRGPCGWCGRREWFPKIVEKTDDKKQEKQANEKEVQK